MRSIHFVWGGSIMRHQSASLQRREGNRELLDGIANGMNRKREDTHMDIFFNFAEIWWRCCLHREGFSRRRSRRAAHPLFAYASCDAAGAGRMQELVRPEARKIEKI
jgi:hypothetical protein